jgi:predicted DNA-binding ribbon-helix-helix protein
MGWNDPTGLIADINMRIELRRLADRALEMDNGPLMAILEVAIGSLDERIADPSSYHDQPPPRRSSGLICRNVRVNGRRTSVKLEAEFWRVLDLLADETGGSIDALCQTARHRHPEGGLTSAIRVFILSSRDEGAPPAADRPSPRPRRIAPRASEEKGA